MGGGGKGLAFLAIILSIGSLAFNFYTYIIVIPEATEGNTGVNNIKQIKYDSSTTPWDPGSSYGDIPDLSLIITVDDGDDLYISFSGQFVVGNTYSTTTGAGIRLMIDDVAQLGSERGFYGDGSGLDHHDIISLQYVVYNMAAGTYHIQIQAYVTFEDGIIDDFNLFAFTFT